MHAADAALDMLPVEPWAAVAEARPQAEAAISRLIAGPADELGACQ